MRRPTLFLAIVAACGSPAEGPPVTGAARFNGTWQIGSASFPMPGGSMNMTRTTTPMSLRGDYTFTATDETHGRLRGRLALLEDDQLDDLSPMDGSVTIDGDAWIVAKGSSTSVFTGALAGDTLTLTFDAADPRNVVPDDPPRELALRRVAAPPSESVGKWKMLSLRFEPLTVPGDTCFSLAPNMWVKVQIVFEVDARHLMERIATLTEYSDADCTRSTGQTIVRADGFIEESATGLEVWARTDHDQRLHSKWTLIRASAGRYRLTRTFSDSSSNMPSELLVEEID
jgi:hypothetical protein